MPDIIRIVIYLFSFTFSAYALSGVDFSKIMKHQSETKIQLLYIFLSLAIGYGVASFVMGISRYSIL
ncbi:DUF1146 domain-containing protein [Erysipelothrix urinaevulpis]|uniref:DUF1146 domain-containing protein n=1 Tax=Erysipelothrix urinaevulpis TaxID=2683717 RepID=UPI0013577203|nr:DUF1146 domain-containing protein [Erysipelothrix urinaevulpis]